VSLRRRFVVMRFCLANVFHRGVSFKDRLPSATGLLGTYAEEYQRSSLPEPWADTGLPPTLSFFVGGQL